MQTFQVPSEASLSSDLVHCWKVICLLVRLERGKPVGVNADVVPVDIELDVGVFTLDYAPVHLLPGNLLNERVFSPQKMDNNPRLADLGWKLNLGTSH